jgi:hypothetical protein
MSRVNLKPEIGSYSLERPQSPLPMASEFCSVHSMLETWMISANSLKKVGVGLVVAKVDVISWRYVYLRGFSPESTYSSRTFIHNSYSLFEQVKNECVSFG